MLYSFYIPKQINFVLLCIFLLSCPLTLATPWSWTKNKIGYAWFAYKTWNIPRPILSGHLSLKSNREKEKFLEFRFSLSKDTEIVKQLRKKLHISGIYLSDESDMDYYKQYVTDPSHYITPVNYSQYVENGFDVDNNNSVSASMGRLFEYHKHTTRKIMSKNEIESFMQLLWEIEKNLPISFDEDDHGIVFVDFIRKMIRKDVPQVEISKKDTEQSFMSIFLGGISDAFEERSIERRQEIAYYLSIWQHYTLRFRNNEGLARAIKEFPNS